MQTINSLPHIPPHEMQQYMKDMAKVDEQLAQQQPQSDNIIEQLSQPAAEQPTEAPQPVQEDTPSLQSLQNANFSMLREKAEFESRERQRLERERDELLQRLRSFEQKQSPAPQATDSIDDLGLAPDALAEGKHISKLYKEMKQMQAQLQQHQQQTRQGMVEAQLKAQYPDFDQIVSAENVESLRRSHPTIAQALATAVSQDAYSAGASAYTIIKEMGIAKSNQEAQMAKRMIQENASKPRSAQAVSPQRGNTPLSQVNEYINDGRMTPEYQEQLLREMNTARMRSR